MTDESELNRKRARRYVEEVLSYENVAAIEEIAAPPREWDDDVTTMDGVEIETYEDAKRWLRRNRSKFEDYSLSVDSVIVDGDEAVVIFQVSGRIVEEWFGVPAAGRPFETIGFSYLEFEDGQIVKLHEQWNMLDFMPEVAKVARQGVVREMRDGIVVIDEAKQIVDVNPAVIETFDRNRDALLGEPVGVLLGEDATVPGAGDSVVITGPDARRYFEVGASPLTDQTGERIGRTLVVRDITDRRRRLQQLEVLNRVLRHNLRNDLQVVQVTLEAARDQATEDVTSLLSQAATTTDGLMDTADTARAVQTALADTDLERQPLDVTVESLVTRARDAYPDATVEAYIQDVPPVEATSALEDALWELVENACEHGGEAPRVEVGLEQRDGAVELTIADDGPGIPDQEREVLRAGEETDLEHGSGLGLWLAYWVLETAGGALTFAVDDGTTVRVTLPAASPE